MGLHVKIHLAEPARTAAADALHPLPPYPQYDRLNRIHDWDAFEDACKAYNEVSALHKAFTGPHFENVENVDVTDGCVVVLVSTETQLIYLYPLSTVARVKQWIEPDAPEWTPPDDDIPF